MLLPLARMNSSRPRSHESIARERTFVMCVPMDRWAPEHSKHRVIPRLILAHSAALSHSAHLSLPFSAGICPSSPMLPSPSSNDMPAPISLSAAEPKYSPSDDSTEPDRAPCPPGPSAPGPPAPPLPGICTPSKFAVTVCSAWIHSALSCSDSACSSHSTRGEAHMTSNVKARDAATLLDGRFLFWSTRRTVVRSMSMLPFDSPGLVFFDRYPSRPLSNTNHLRFQRRIPGPLMPAVTSLYIHPSFLMLAPSEARVVAISSAARVALAFSRTSTYVDLMLSRSAAVSRRSCETFSRKTEMSVSECCMVWYPWWKNDVWRNMK
mmetsp:Transcript_69654/g.194696  ORF Transcript_69654/g.194696 Transcript_69654/m.194696 type:complete len:322 (-) Transcript_69654:725-1690(-)